MLRSHSFLVEKFLRRIFRTHAFSFKKIRHTLRLAVPCMGVALLDTMLGLVDTIVAAQLDTASLAALAIVNGLFWGVVCIVSGLFAGLDTYFPQAQGAQDSKMQKTLLVQGLWLSFAVSLLAGLLIVGIAWGYQTLGLMPDLQRLIWSYLWAIIPGIPCIAVLTVFEKYWRSQNVVKPFVVLMVLLNGLNYWLNTALVQGWYSDPMGVVGIASSTTLCRSIAVVLVLAGSIYTHWRKMPTFIRPWSKKGSKYASNRAKSAFSAIFSSISTADLRLDWQWQERLARIGIPSFGHLLADVVAFNLLTLIAAKLGVISVGAHQIIFMIHCLLFMIPLGISHSAGVQIGQYIGEEKRHSIAACAKLHQFLSLVFLTLGTGWMAIAPEFVTKLFTTDRELTQELIPLIMLAVVIQWLDGIQIIYAASLRALGQVTPVFRITLVAFYGLGLPLAFILGVYLNQGVFGLWVGMGFGLLAMAVCNRKVWQEHLFALLKEH